MSAQFFVTGGPALNLLKRDSGRYVVQLRIAHGDQAPDWHCVSYDGRDLKDNSRHSRVKRTGAEDTQSKQAAHAVFASLFPGYTVRITNIYELVALPHSGC